MRLHEEYIYRHQLNVPVVLYDNRSTVFLRSKYAPFFWRVVHISWHSCHWHPGNFNIRVYGPVHDCGNNLRDVISPIDAYWDEYEEKIFSLVNEIQYDFKAIPRSESSLAAWCIFLVMYDSYLSRLSKEVHELIAESINIGNDFRSRHSAYRNALSKIMSEDSELYYTFRMHIMPLADRYAEWLVKLING